MKPINIIFCVGAILGAGLLPTHGKPVKISLWHEKGQLNRGLNHCNKIYGCEGLDGEISPRTDLASIIWARADGEGAEGAGAGAGGGRGGGGRDEGPRDGGDGDEPEGGVWDNPTPPSDYLAGSDGSLSDRTSDDIKIDDTANTPASDEVLELPEYEEKGQGYYHKMMQAVHQTQKHEPRYGNINDRYRQRSALRLPLDTNLELGSESGAAILYLKPIISPPEINVDPNAEDWTFRMITAIGKPVPENGIDIDEESTLVTYGSKSQKTLIVTWANTVENDIPNPANLNAAKLPNSEQIFQHLQQQAGDAIADTKFIVMHGIYQKGTQAVLRDAYESKGLALTSMATWTVNDGSIFWRILGTRNGRSAVFLLTDHPTAMHNQIVTKIYTWAQIPNDPNKFSAMVIELGSIRSA